MSFAHLPVLLQIRLLHCTVELLLNKVLEAPGCFRGTFIWRTGITNKKKPY